MEANMRKTTLSAIGVLTALLASTALGSPPQNPGEERHSHDPIIVRPLTHPRGLSKVSLASVRPFYKSKSEWQHIIDSTWGPGLPLSTKLAIFDDYATVLARKFDGFLSLGLNWDSLRTHYRSKIDSSTSRGRFAAIMARFAMSLRDGHTSALDTIVAYSPLAPGVPLLVLSPFATAEHFGAVLTTLPDSSALVLRTVTNHPLGLEPGDVILGYEGVPWKRLVKELLDADLPVNSDGIGARSAETHALLRNVGNNWHLFETIDILKYSTKETVHLSVYPLLSLPSGPIMGNEQLDIAGVPSAYYFVTFNSQGLTAIGQPVNYGKLPTANVGYIRLLGEWPTSTTDSKFAEAVNALWDTKGLIIDLRWNSGGWALFDQAFARMFSQRMFTINDAYRVNQGTFDLAPVAHSEWFLIPGTPGSVYDRPIAVLLGPTCVSMGDVTAQRLRYHPMVRFFGKPPIGSLGDNEFLDRYQFWKLHYSICDMYHLSQSGLYLNRSEFPIDESVWLTPDDVAKGDDTVVKRALEWISTLTYAHNTGLDRYYGRPGVDSLTLTAVLANPPQHASRVSAVVTDYGLVRDSMLFYNDGLHGDGTAGDSIWGARLLAPANEGTFSVSVETKDLTQGTSRLLPNVLLMTTAGPLALDTVQYQDNRDNSNCEVLPFVKNMGSTAPFKGATVRLICTDPWVTGITPAELSLYDIAAGETRNPNVSFWIKYNPSIIPDTFNLKFELGMSGHVCWTVPVILNVGPVVEVAQKATIPTAYALTQNYPNPFNPTTTIKFELPKSSDVKLSVYDVLGREVSMLVNEKRNAGVHEVTFDGANLASGVYIYRLTAGDYVQSKKLIVLR
jgi:hypothetical protein